MLKLKKVSSRYMAIIFVLSILLPIFSASPSLSAEPKKTTNPILWILEGELLGGYSEIEGREGIGTAIANWLVSPTVRVNESTRWINLYNGSYNRSAQVVAQEEGGRQTEETQTHSLSSALKYDVNPTWSLRPLFFADWVFVNETEDESFGDGLYDYRDIGGGLESTWTTLKTPEYHNECRLGFRYLDREYENYRSLLSLIGNPIEQNEKDLQGYKFNASHESRSKNGWSWGLEGIFFYKDYTDKRTINNNGILQSDTREDFVEYVNAYLSHPLAPEWTFRLDGQFAVNDSNLDFYDTHNTLSLADDDFIGDYFDYLSFTATPSLTFRRSLAKNKDLIVMAAYSFHVLHYPDRRRQSALGVYGSEEQEDIVHTVTGRVSVPLTENFSWVSSASYATADSNQDFEQFYLYSYDLWTAVTGISFKY